VGFVTERPGVNAVLGRSVPPRDLLRWAPDTVYASAIARDDVFFPSNPDIRTQHFPEETQFRVAEPLTLACRRADRTVVLNEKKVPFPCWLHFRHVAFFGSQASELLKFLFE